MGTVPAPRVLQLDGAVGLGVGLFFVHLDAVAVRLRFNLLLLEFEFLLESGHGLLVVVPQLLHGVLVVLLLLQKTRFKSRGPFQARLELRGQLNIGNFDAQHHDAEFLRLRLQRVEHRRREFRPEVVDAVVRHVVPVRSRSRLRRWNEGDGSRRTPRPPRGSSLWTGREGAAAAA